MPRRFQLTPRFLALEQEANDVVRDFGKQHPLDMERAQAVASAAIAVYGDLSEREIEDMRVNGIWNDHVAVQAALAAIRMMSADHDQLMQFREHIKTNRKLLPAEHPDPPVGEEPPMDEFGGPT